MAGQERTFGLERNNWNYGQSASFEGPINQAWKHEHPVTHAIVSTHATIAARVGPIMLVRRRNNKKKQLKENRLVIFRILIGSLCWMGKKIQIENKHLYDIDKYNTYMILIKKNQFYHNYINYNYNNIQNLIQLQLVFLL